MRRSLALVLVVAVLGLAAWLILHRGAGSTTSAIAPNRENLASDRASSSLDAPANVDALRATLPSDKESAGSISSATEGSPTLIVHVLSKADGSSLARVRVTVKLANSDFDTWEDVDATRGDLVRAPISDASGRVEIAVPAGEALLVTASSEAEGCGMSAMEVHALTAHERREVDLHIPCGQDLRFFGRLLDRETRRPVLGASVRLMSAKARAHFGAAGKMWQGPDALHEIHTDANGDFDLALASWTEPYLEIEAEGYGLLLALLQSGHESADRAQVLTIAREGVLHAFVLDAAERPIPGTVLVLKARGFDLQNGGDEEEPGTWVPFPDKEWKAKLDDHGGCTIAALPALVPLAVEVRQGEQLSKRVPESLQFQPGERMERTWKIGAGARIEGRIVDQLNAPVANHAIWLLKKEGPGDGYIEPYKGDSAIAKATSDVRGTFALEDVPIGSWWIAAAPAADVHAVPGPDDVASRTQSVEVTSADKLWVTLTVTRGLLVRGFVLDPEGKTVSDVFVTCTQNNEWFPAQTHTDDKGAFVLGPLAPGTCELWANGEGSLAASDKVRAEPGQIDVVLRLHAAGSISGRVIDASTGKWCGATIHVKPDHTSDNGMSGEIEGETRAEGQFEFEGLLPDRYQLSFMTSDGRFAIVSGVAVTAGKETADVVAKVVPGAVLSIRNEAKVRGASFRVSIGLVPLTFERGIDVNTRESISVPAGRITLEYWTLDEKRTRSLHTQAIDVAVGETREVVLRDDG